MHDSASHLTDEQLSLRLDDQLDADELATTDAHLTTCLRCADALSELHATVSALRALPEPRLPRSFQIQPDHHPSLWSRILSWDIGIRGLAAAAAALFMVLIVGDLSSVSQPKMIVPISISSQAKGAPEARTANIAPTAVAQPAAAAPAASGGAAAAPPPARRAEPAADAAAPPPPEAARVEAFTARESVAGAAGALSGLSAATLGAGALAVILIIAAVVRSVRRA